MYRKGSKKSSVTFSYKPPKNAGKVELAGDFNAWKPQAMKKKTDGSFSLAVQANRQALEYKFVVDGCWVTDPDNPHLVANPFNSFNSLARVEFTSEAGR